MSTIELFAEANRPVAAIATTALTPAQRDAVYSLLPSHARLSFQLSKRWAVWGVMCTPEWESDQLHRRPMLKPKGQTFTLDARSADF